MKSGNKKLILLIALLVVVGGAIMLLPTTENTAAVEVEEGAKSESGDIINVDDDMPTFSVEMTNGETITAESLRGKVVLVNFWATWCPPCREEFTRVQKDIVERFADTDLVFLPISRGEDRATVEKFLSENGYTLPVGLDTDQSIYKKFAEEYIPRNYLINRHGVVVKTTIGYESEEFDTLLQTIQMTLNAR